MEYNTIYTCLMCGSTRRIFINPEAHKYRIGRSSNGLAIYSDIHNCWDGFIGVNNLYVDKDFNPRSFSMLELPEERKSREETKLAIPGAPRPKRQYNIYNITQMLDDPSNKKKDFRLIITDERSNVKINIGRVDEDNEEAIGKIQSKDKFLALRYYAPELYFNRSLKVWFEQLLNVLEVLPPTKTGLFIETLRYIHYTFLSDRSSPPGTFEIIQVRTMLSSHKTYYELQTGIPRLRKIKHIGMKYGHDKKAQVQEIINYIEENPEISLAEFVKIYPKDMDLIYFISLFLILEGEGIIKIIYPKDDT